MDPRVVKWRRWLEIVKSEIQQLVIAKHTFHEVQEIIAENPAIQKPNSYYSYLANTYASHVVMGLRRQIKVDENSISLARLLTEMSQTPQLVRREDFVRLYIGSVVEDRANHDFDKFARPESPHIDPEQVLADLKDLRAKTLACEEFADRRVAHRDKRKLTKIPTYNEVDECIEFVDGLYTKYHLLFHAANMESLVPTWQYDWKEIFRTPWIPPEK